MLDLHLFRVRGARFKWFNGWRPLKILGVHYLGYIVCIRGGGMLSLLGTQQLSSFLYILMKHYISEYRFGHFDVYIALVPETIFKFAMGYASKQ